jgi:hypothetical protein
MLSRALPPMSIRPLNEWKPTVTAALASHPSTHLLTCLRFVCLAMSSSDSRRIERERKTMNFMPIGLHYMYYTSGLVYLASRELAAWRLSYPDT